LPKCGYSVSTFSSISSYEGAEKCDLCTDAGEAYFLGRSAQRRGRIASKGWFRRKGRCLSL
jgi:hypothetical protein